ncbi:formin [Parambassis ranga]|uniref:Formin n=1 Tax=Parambassis ranga TaxID=210632 RepID=A0A6P7HI66_9TELE|nr:formin-like [Parambassis ranga]
MQMEEQQAILTFFRTLSETECEGMRKDNVKESWDAAGSFRDSLSCVLLPHEGENSTHLLGCLGLWAEGNHTDTAEEENDFNLTEQQSRQGSAADHDQTNEHKVKTMDECVLNGDLQDDTKDVCQEHFTTTTSSADPDKQVKNKRAVITLTRTLEVQEEPEDDEEGVEDEEDKKKDAFPESPTELQTSPTQSNTLPNVIITSAGTNSPHGSTLTRGTFCPGSPTEKQIQLPALFSGLRVLRKGVVGPGHNTVALIKPPSSQGEKQWDSKAHGGFLDQISQFLSREKRDDESEERKADGDQDVNKKEESQEKKEDAEVSDAAKSSVSSAEAAFDAFKAFFTPKPLKKDPAEKVDLEAVRKKIRADKDVLNSLFDRTSSKTPGKKDQTDEKSEASTPGEGEERTPGRLQAIWPPLKEEKVGLKYTEAEHQAALLQLKRECKEELEKLQGDYGQEISRLRLENEDTVAHLEIALAELQAELSQAGTHCRGELRDAAVSTGDDLLHKSFRTVCIQTDRETFIKSPKEAEGMGPVQQKVTPNKLDLASISLSLASEREETLTSSSSSSPQTSLQTATPGDSLPLSEQPAASFQITKSDTLAPPSPPVNLAHSPTPPQLPPLPPPPPPSITGLVAPPPPPPPPFSGGLIPDKPPRKPAVEPSKPMKPLYWTRIQIQDNNNTLWSALKEPNIINTSEFEDLFAKTTTQAKRKPLSEAYEKKAKARKIIKLLDGKRSQAVGILISSLHLEMKDIQQAVLTVDHSVVDLETIEALYENRAQPEELERIKRHYETSAEEDIKLLDKPEQFLYELSQIPDFAGRARCIIFQSAFIDGIASTQRKLNTVSSVCKALLGRDSVREVMGLVLALGNHMNGGNRSRGQADGFGLEILPKLKDVKSRDNRISLVDYVVSYYLRNVDKNAGTDKSVFPLPEPQDVFLAAQVKFDDLKRDQRQLGRDLTRCEKDVQNVCSDSPEEHLQPFKDKMEAFSLKARKEHTDASYELRTAQQSFQELVLYFGLKPKAGETEVTTAHFFMLWFEFCADFKARWKRENKNISKERLKEAQLSVRRITGEKKVETRKVNPNSLKERLRQKEANIPST